MEIWKDIPGYEGIYQVSSCGRVRSLDKVVDSKFGSKSMRKGKEMKQYVAHNGYMRVTLQNNRTIKNLPVHYLVLKTFVGERPEGMQINHKDEDKKNNNVENLEYCTPKYNANYGDRNKKITEKNCKPIVGYNADGEEVCRFKSAKEAEKDGYSNSHICQCLKGYRNKHKGLTWKYTKTIDAK